MPIGQYGPPNDMFDPLPWDYKSVVAHCQSKWQVTPRPNWIIENFGGKKDLGASGVSNIVFTNGDLDP